MVSWMKRRIHRSRARCQKALLANREKARLHKSEKKLSKESATDFRTDSHHTNDK